MQKQIRFDQEYIKKANKLSMPIYTAKEVADILEAAEELYKEDFDKYLELLRSG